MTLVPATPLPSKNSWEIVREKLRMPVVSTCTTPIIETLFCTTRITPCRGPEGLNAKGIASIYITEAVAVGVMAVKFQDMVIISPRF